MGPNDKFDLLIKGGDVLDPSQIAARQARHRHPLRRRSRRSRPTFRPTRALRVLDAGGKLVTPGLIDLHCHVYPYGSAIGIPADELVPHQCTTTCVSAGDAGANNFAAFRRYIVGADAHAPLRLRAHRQHGARRRSRLPSSTTSTSRRSTPAAKAVAENADIAIGVKVRMSENVIAKNGIEPLKRAIAACENAGTGGKVMCHIGGVETRELMSQILDTLRPGDILTHAIRARPTSPATSPTSCRTASCCRRRSPPSSAA